MKEVMINSPHVLDLGPGVGAAAIGLRIQVDGRLLPVKQCFDLLVDFTAAAVSAPQVGPIPLWAAGAVHVTYHERTDDRYHVIVRGPADHLLLDDVQRMDPHQWRVFRQAMDNMVALAVLDDDYRLDSSLGLILVSRHHVTWNGESVAR